MATVTKQSPMNLKHLNDAEIGIDALSRARLATHLLDFPLDLESLRDRLPGL